MNKDQAMDTYCPMKLSMNGSGLMREDYLCHTNSCMAWREEECAYCNGKGEISKMVTVEKNGKLMKQLETTECHHCEGSGAQCYCGMTAR